MKSLFKIFAFLMLFSCSTNDSGSKCPNWYYVYLLEDCSCNSIYDSCATYQIIDKDIYMCLDVLLNSSESDCIYIDESTCPEVTFSGYIKEVVEDCLEIDL
ncbi:hypothetical protein [Winogradskyella aquimaris]|uniref:Lipoprotein n=1 Tax=Winogradskyella aquimaris TaxID=864074 RepID=A0ABU5ENA8_9FLAO|nr:hypothetical protein [Winogradskyella aquimaris]MDY2587058.1 hypothetical protein [Winogradskyella aquimaris]